MKKRFKPLALLLVLLLLLSGIAFAEETAGEADLLFINGVVYTVDANDSIAQALAVRDGKIIFVGSDEEAATYAGDNTQTIDLEGKFMIPGLIDGHLHSITPAFFDFDLLGIMKDSAIALGGETVYDAETLHTALQDFQAVLNACGYTTIMMLPAFGTMPVPFDAYRTLEDEGKLTLKVHGHQHHGMEPGA